MPKPKNEKADLALELYRSGWKPSDIAAALDVPPGTVRRWKCAYNWEEKAGASAHIEANARPPSRRKAALTEKQRLFILYYAKNFNATRAYQKAYGCSYAAAMVNGSNMLRNPKIREEIARIKREQCAKALLAPDDVFQKYLEIAFADVTDFVEFSREEVPVMAMYGPVTVKDPDTGEKVPLTRTVNVVRTRSSGEVDGTLLTEVSQGKDGFKVKLADRMKALQWLSDHMDLATEEQRARIAKLRAETPASAESPDGGADDPITAALKESHGLL